MIMWLLKIIVDKKSKCLINCWINYSYASNLLSWGKKNKKIDQPSKDG